MAKAGLLMALAVAANCTLSACGSMIGMSNYPEPACPFYLGVHCDLSVGRACFRDTDCELPLRLFRIGEGLFFIADLPLSAYVDTAFLPLIAMDLLLKNIGSPGHPELEWTPAPGQHENSASPRVHTSKLFPPWTYWP
jgi:uncharacterized protein YceK